MIFQKPKRKLWTWRHPAGHFSQIDYIIYRKRWRNSVHDCQAHTSSVAIRGDPDIVTATIKLIISLRASRKVSKRQPCWLALREDNNLPKFIDVSIAYIFKALPAEKESYSSFVSIYMELGKESFPCRLPQPTPTVESATMAAVRNTTLTSAVPEIKHCQKIQLSIFD